MTRLASRVVLLLLVSLAPSLPAARAQSTAPAPKPPGLRLGEDARPTRYALDLTVVPSEETFAGSMEVDLDLRHPTRLVWLNAKELTISEATIAAGGQTSPARVVPGDEETVGFAFDAPVGPGPARLRVAYRGTLNAVDTAALFREKYGEDWYAFTQFQDLYARRAFPCVDEPGFKVPWQLTVHARREHEVIANTPVVSTVDEPNGMKAVQFAETKPLPSYLVALAVGPFDLVDAGTAGRNRTPLRVVAPRGRGAEAKFAAEITPRLVDLLEEFFEIPYPYEKLDQVAIPITYGFGAMENAGLITYDQGILLARPERDTPARQSSYAYTAAHEIAHQWFGNLVTMRWWDDLWLNEGFATWMEGKIVERWKPELNPRVGEVWSKSGVMASDSLLTARMVRQPIASKDDIANAFDSITYQKGAAVLRMFEAWLGPDAFRDGVRRYLKAHAWSSATTADFVAALGTSAGRDLAPAFSSFVDQPGVPLVTVELRCGAGATPTLVLSQQRYVPVGSTGAKPQIWQIPLAIRYKTGTSAPVERRVLMTGSRLEVPIETGGCPSWIVANAEATGYYYVHYSGDLLERLFDHMDSLSVPERVSLATDLQALARGGHISAGDALALAPRLFRDPHPYVKAGATGLHGDFGETLPDDLLPNYARFLTTTYGETARQLGWKPAPNEPEEVRILRTSIVGRVAEEGKDPVLVAEAKRLLTTWLADTSTLDTDTAAAVLRIAAREGDAALFERLKAGAEKTRDLRLRGLLFFGMGSFVDPEILQRAFELTLSDSFDTRESIQILWTATGDRRTHPLAFDFLRRNYGALVARLPKDYAAQLVYFGSGFCDATRRAEVEAFFADKVSAAPGGTRNLAQVLEGIDLCAARRAASAASLAAALRRY